MINESAANGPPVEVRPPEARDKPKKFDELIVTDPAFVHFEMMDSDRLWVGITRQNGETVTVNICGSRKRGSFKGDKNIKRRQFSVLVEENS